MSGLATGALSGWNHRHVIDLAAFSLDDYATVLALAQRFRSLPGTGARRLPPCRDG